MNRSLGILTLIALAVFVWSGITPTDRFTWLLEVLPGVIGIAVLAFTFSRFRFTTLAYTLIAIHVCILFVGGHYTYERVPLFNWIRDHFHLSRNHYDRLGHFAQGFVPAILAREVLIRFNVVRTRRWLAFLVICICMTISAVYELFEWLTAVLSGSSANAFLGTQGDVWDTQEDMLCALVGAVLALALLSRLHDAQIHRINSSPT